jgi:hypothetical protein
MLFLADRDICKIARLLWHELVMHSNAKNIAHPVILSDNLLSLSHYLLVRFFLAISTFHCCQSNSVNGNFVHL